MTLNQFRCTLHIPTQLQELKMTVAIKVNKSTKVTMTTKKKSVATQNTTYSPLNIFMWDTPTTKVKKNERPINVLDKAPDEHDAKSIEQLVVEFENDALGKLAFDKLAKEKIARSFSKLPRYEEIKLRDLLSALSVQRPVSNRHIKNILETFDEKKIQYVNVLKIKFKGKFYYYIIDGQHTAITYGVFAKWGYFAPEVDPKNWQDVKIKCQVVEFNNFTFAREHFLGINGDDKLKLVAFDRWKNYVLAKRQDSPDDVTNDKYEDAFSQQTILESFGIIPVHERDDENKDKPGAFVRVDLLKELSEEEITWFCRVHQMNWDDRAVDSFEVLPMVSLRHKLKGTKSLDNAAVKEFVLTLGNIIKNIAGSPAKFRTLAETTYKEWHKTAYPGERVSSTPADVSLALLLQIYYAHGGKFNSVSKMFMDDYNEQGFTLFHALDQDLQDMITS